MSLFKYAITIALYMVIGSQSIFAQTEPHIGVVSIINNIVSAEKNNKESIFTNSDKIYPGQTIKTLMNSKVQILFRDQTILNLGPDTELLITSYANKQQTNKFSLNILRGIARIQSGTLPSEAYEIKSPVAVINLKGTKVDFLVSQSGGTEIVLRNGLATVKPSPINLRNRNQTFLPNDTLELQEKNTFLRLTSGRNSKVQPQTFKNKLNDFYDQEIKVEQDGTIQIASSNTQRLLAERTLNNRLSTSQQIDTIDQSNSLLRNVNKSTVLIKLINEQLKQCIGPKCTVLLNKRSILNQVKTHLRDRSTALINRTQRQKPERPKPESPTGQSIPKPPTQDLEAIAKLKRAIAKIAKEDAKLAKDKAKKAKKGAKSARKDAKAARQTVKQAKKALKEAKGSGADAVSKAKEALKEAKAARKEAKTVAKDAKSKAKSAKAAAKKAKSSAKSAKQQAKEATKKAKQASQAAAKKAKAASKAATKKAKAASKAATQKAKAASKAATKKAKAASKAAAKKAKAARKAAAKKAKAARKKAQAAAKKARKEARKAAKAARDKAAKDAE